jgi:poly(3-hydroxybutyrate) depolymerase/surface polysaccharide O-acyltransferase-like enzyme
VDLMRVLTIAGVIAVHVVTGTNRSTSVPAGAATILLHVNREVFILITALVLTYSYAARDQWSLTGFWRRRYWLVATPYVAWTLIYFLADGPPDSAGEALRQLGLDLLSGGARYHLYFLLVSMQLYLVFPPLLALVRATRGRHALLLAASAALQLAFTAAFHYRIRPGGPFDWWLDHPDALLPSYQLYIVVGAVLALHLRELTDWVRRHRVVVAAGVLAGAAFGLGSYGYDVAFRLLRPPTASEVFQPAVTVESLAAVLGLFALGVWWADRLRPGWLARAIRAASDASFGIYLGHPLVLQGLLALATLSGALTAVLALPGRVTLAVGLLVALPLILSVTWVGVWLARRSPLSLALTGRTALPAGGPGRRSVRAARGLRTAALTLVLASGIGWLDLSSVRVGAPGADGGGPPVEPLAPLSAALAASEAPTAPAGTSASLEDVRIGGLVRSFQVIRPEQPTAARLPALVVLHGVSATIGYEEERDGFLPLVSSGQLIVAYAVGFEQSWNAGTCCGAAAVQDIDDVSFLTALADRLAADPGVDPDRISLLGYSNGGKMAYRMACERPNAYTSVTVVLGIPAIACSDGPSVPVLQIAVMDDNEIPYAPGDRPYTANGAILTPVTSETAYWRDRDDCAPASDVRTTGMLRIEEWSRCDRGARVELATYASGGHYWPAGDVSTPAAGQVAWDFVRSF